MGRSVVLGRGLLIATLSLAVAACTSQPPETASSQSASKLASDTVAASSGGNEAEERQSQMLELESEIERLHQLSRRQRAAARRLEGEARDAAMQEVRETRRAYHARQRELALLRETTKEAVTDQPAQARQ